MRQFNKLVGLVALAGLALGGCVADVGDEQSDISDSPEHEGARAVPGTGAQYDRFREFEASDRDTYGVDGYLPPNSELADVYYDMTESQRKGLATWHLFAGARGDFFGVSQQVTWNGGNMLRVADDRKRSTRFETTGLLNDPDCTPAAGPDQFGLWLPTCAKDPYSTGIVGLRLRPNPDFDLAAWKRLGNGDVKKAADKWLRSPKDRFEWKSDQLAEDIAVQPPYEVSMACTICHATVNPLIPPANPNAASWKNIVFALGNQYFQEGKVFGDGIPSDDFLRQVLDSQHPGTSDTSRMATDHIHNPNTINAIFNLPYRPLHKERVKQFDGNGQPVDNYDIKYDTCDGETCEVDTFRVLKDGADSSGVSGAALRVFINIGSCYSEFKANMDPVWGVKHPTAEGRIETPISRKKLADECGDYQHLIQLAPYLIDYLTFVKPYRLANARGGAEHVKDWNDPQMKLGRQVFAEECATCHSSIQPEFPDRNPSREDTLWERDFATWSLADQKAWLKDPTRVAFFKDHVEDPAFFEQNYLADDRRWPLQLIGAQSGRALGTNAAPGNVWEEYASVDYQTLPPVDVPIFKFELGSLRYVKTIKSKPGVGYLRTPSLWGIWTSAPFLHNNSLGSFDRGITVEARLRNYQDGMERLLGLSSRPGLLQKTDRWTFLTTIPLGFRLPDILPGIDLTKLRLGVPIPPGVPVASAANLELSALHLTSLRLADVLRIIIDGPNFWQERMQDFITVFDPIEDKGHEFGTQRTVEERRALIEFLKTL